MDVLKNMMYLHAVYNRLKSVNCSEQTPLFGGENVGLSQPGVETPGYVLGTPMGLGM